MTPRLPIPSPRPGRFSDQVLRLVVALILSPALFAQSPDTDAQFFESKIRPVLVDKCYSCHSAESKKLKADLYVDTREGLLKGGESGPALIPGKPDDSRLIEAIRYTNPDLQMPPKAKLSDAQIADLTDWVKRGAPWGKASGGGVVAAKSAWSFDQKKGDHWAWKPLHVEPPPTMSDKSWPRDAVDHFLLASLETKHLKPAPDADRRALIRRASFDLIGLPPTPEEVEAFVADTSPVAWPKVIDRLLASPHFGERWARHWMDLVRYAEGYGHEFDYEIENAYQYRDYLIRAFNADVPYDQFVTEHIAGDLLPKPRINPVDQFNESIIATGFWFLGEQVHAPVDSRQDQADRLDNQIDVMGKTFLAVTLGCARCHDHKFDPIPQKDVYGLWGYLEGTRRQIASLDPHGKVHQAAQSLAALRERGSALLAKPPAEDPQIAAYLAAACEAIDGNLTCEELAKRESLDSPRLQRWIDALNDEALKSPTHPLYPLYHLTRKPLPAGQFAKKLAALATDLEKRRQATQDELQKTILFKDFKSTAFDGWYRTGEAFGAAVTRAGQWNTATTKPHLVEQPAADSVQLAFGLDGVLRSPDFIIQHDTILTYCAGNAARLRLIVDNYEMGVHSGLLFADHQPVINSPEFRWVKQTKDIARYLGHRAHLEIIDNGDGWIAVDEIRFADGNPLLPPPPPSGTAIQLAHDTSIDSMPSLVAATGKAIQRAIDDHATPDTARIVNWLLDHQLIEIAKDDLADVGRQIQAFRSNLPKPMRVLAAADGTGVDERIFIRGNPKNLGEPAPRHFLRVIAGDEQPSPDPTCGRLTLARQLTDPANPLFSRVIVNRLWHHLFGRGIVASTDNFGALGTPPTHPELLDFLADRFIHEGYSIKRTLRELMLSRAYQMSTAATDQPAEEADPQNLLLHRANLRRLEAECIRDEILTVSGRLDPTLFGPSVAVHLTPFMDGRGKPETGPLDGAGRRSLYLATRRNFLSPMLLAFDTPIPFSTMGRRSVSNVPAQALILMNDPFVHQQAKLWATQTLRQGGTVDARITRMYQQAFARPPTPSELAAARTFLTDDAPDTWTDYAHVLFNLKEFIFLK